MKKSLLTFAILTLIFAYSCKHSGPDIATNPGSGPGGTGGGSTKVCFETDILPIFQTNCAKSGCHDAASMQKGYVFDSYNNIVKKDVKPFDAADSKVYKVLFKTGTDRMPKPPNPPLTNEQKNLIGRWINEGAANTTNCGTSCDSTRFAYAANIQPILQNHCTGCHSGTAPASGLDLTTYQSVKNIAQNGLFINVVMQTPGFPPMPKGAAKLSDCKISQIRKWIQAGAPNN